MRCAKSAAGLKVESDVGLPREYRRGRLGWWCEKAERVVMRVRAGLGGVRKVLRVADGERWRREGGESKNSKAKIACFYDFDDECRGSALFRLQW